MTTAEQTTGVPTGTWQHDPVHSSISFAVKYNRDDIPGAVRRMGGDARGRAARGLGRRLERARRRREPRRSPQTPDFFDAEQSPKLRFESTSIERDGDKVTIAGDLTIKGTTKPIELTGTISGPVTDGYGNERIGLDVTTVVNRHDYGVSWNADLPGGAAMLEDDVTINANLALTQK